MAVNYQKILSETLGALSKTGKTPRLPEQTPDEVSDAQITPRLLLHSCCGPCSSYVLEYLSAFFDITVLYYNPNIWPTEEFLKRAETQRQLVADMAFKNPVRLTVAEYRPEAFDAVAEGLETEPEGGKRCLECFRLRLEETAKHAENEGFDYFTTTLSVSPHKDAEALNQIGRELEARSAAKYLYADFKKQNGYKRSIELSKQYGLYRQDYCGCRFSINSALQSMPDNAKY